MAQLHLKNLRKQFATDVVPVKDISLTVDDGEFLTLLGPSGCGKSTLLRLIAGLEQPTSGQVFLGEEDLTNIPPGDRNMAMVFQSYALYPHMTVAENIAAALKIRKIPLEEIKNRVSSVANNLGLSHLLNRKPGQLSGGQRQRVALARALVRNPEVFLLDEPLSNLDALLREQVRKELKQLFATQNKPVVYVTHDQTEAMTLSSKVGSPQINLLTLNCQGNKAMLGDFVIPLPDTVSSREIVDLGIRPEDLKLATDSDQLVIEGEVFLVENFGRELLASMKVRGSNDTLRILIEPDQSWSKENLKVALNPRKINWFDAKTGERY